MGVVFFKLYTEIVYNANNKQIVEALNGKLRKLTNSGSYRNVIFLISKKFNIYVDSKKVSQLEKTKMEEKYFKIQKGKEQGSTWLT